jgi:hypothetical protein
MEEWCFSITVIPHHPDLSHKQVEMQMGIQASKVNAVTILKVFYDYFFGERQSIWVV